jgi:hypothetical protein
MVDVDELEKWVKLFAIRCCTLLEEVDDTEEAEGERVCDTTGTGGGRLLGRRECCILLVVSQRNVLRDDED